MRDEHFSGATAPDRLTGDLVRPTLPGTTGKGFYWTAALLGLCALAGLAAWIHQLMHGLSETGMKNSVTWGVYIINFVFFIGISHAGVLISAILRIFHAEWCRPVTRVAEAVTVFALLMGGLQITADLGRPGRMLNILFSGRLASPMIWDVICISVYFLSCLFFLLLPMIPDMATMKNRPEFSPRRQKLYQRLSLGWTNHPEQQRRLHKAIALTAVLLVPVAVSVHTVVSWIFGMTVRPMWHAPFLGPYFVVGAIFSGVAALTLILAAVRKHFHLQNYLKPVHFTRLNTLLLVMCALWFYFTLSEWVTTGYGAMGEEATLMAMKTGGPFRWIFWTMMLCMATAAITLLTRKKHAVSASVTASIAVITGMWLERFLIIVPTLTRTMEEGYRAGTYFPTTVEWLITLGSLAGFVLLFMLFTRLFPVISIWETRGAAMAMAQSKRRMDTYLPDNIGLAKDN